MSSRILHTFANFKWTGPADPAIRCAVELRRLGADVCFAQAEWTLPNAEHRMRIELRKARMPVIAGLELRKHFHLRSQWRDARALRRRLSAGEFEVVHTHQLGDQLSAALAVRRFRGERPRIVRSLYEPLAPKRSWRHVLAMRHTDGVVVPTRACAEGLIERFNFAPERVLYQDPPIESARRRLPFGQRDLDSRQRDVARQEQRRKLGIAPGDVVIGITARIQPHRRFELLWAVAERVIKASGAANGRPDVRFLLLGRGNPVDTDRLVTQPIREAGIGANVILPGYLYEPSYSQVLNSLDGFMFLVPGSDGTCRAVREAMSFGLPVVTTRRGLLPELCAEHPAQPGVGPGGVCCEEDAAAMADQWLAWVDDPDLRERFGRAARTRADGPMNPGVAARRLLGFYERLAGLPGRWDGES